MTRPIRTGLLIIAALVVLLVAWVVFLRTPDVTSIERPFNSVDWKAAGSRYNTRCNMIADLRRRVGIVGKSRAELEALLGPAEDEDSDPSSSHWHLCPSLADIYILEVQWDGDRVSRETVRDT